MNDVFDLKDFVFLCDENGKISLTEKEKKNVKKSRKILEKLLKENPQKSYYGVNTGVGALLQKIISPRDWNKFQENLIMSHACGVGNPLEKEIVKGMMLHMILNLKKGYSGIGLKTLELLVEMFNRNLIPVVPEIGSVGASGDLVPQAHIALVLIGNGEIWYGSRRDKKSPANVVFSAEGLNPAKLKVGEAIALLNGTSLMTSSLARTIFYAKNLIEMADIAAAMTMAALNANIQSFDYELQKIRPHFGQNTCASHILNLLSGAIEEKAMLQDAYSLRCAPQVHGAALDFLYPYAWHTVSKEINSFTGNPVILSRRVWNMLEREENSITVNPTIINEIWQGSGNFHGQPLAQVADGLAIALTNLSAISERRIERLLNPKLSGLPAFLAEGEGLNSGLMVAQYTAAALVAKNKTLAAPASIHSISVSASQEDFVSMGATGAMKVWEVLKNTQYVIAIELLCAAQALDLQGKLKDQKIKKIHQIIRKHVPRLKKDRILAKDIEKIFNLLRSFDGRYETGNEFLAKVEEATGTFLARTIK